MRFLESPPKIKTSFQSSLGRRVRWWWTTRLDDSREEPRASQRETDRARERERETRSFRVPRAALVVLWMVVGFFAMALGMDGDIIKTGWMDGGGFGFWWYGWRSGRMGWDGMTRWRLEGGHSE